MDALRIPAGLAGTLAIAAFLLALLAMLAAPVFARSRRFTGPSSVLALPGHAFHTC